MALLSLESTIFKNEVGSAVGGENETVLLVDPLDARLDVETVSKDCRSADASETTAAAAASFSSAALRSRSARRFLRAKSQSSRLDLDSKRADRSHAMPLPSSTSSSTGAGSFEPFIRCCRLVSPSHSWKPSSSTATLGRPPLATPGYFGRLFDGVKHSSALTVLPSGAPANNQPVLVSDESGGEEAKLEPGVVELEGEEEKRPNNRLKLPLEAEVVLSHEATLLSAIGGLIPSSSKSSLSITSSVGPTTSGPERIGRGVAVEVEVGLSQTLRPVLAERCLGASGRGANRMVIHLGSFGQSARKGEGRGGAEDGEEDGM